MRKDRLKKLADFLDKLPKDKWIFDKIASGDTQCPSVGCALGWLPTIFPRSYLKLETDEYGYLNLHYKGRLDFSAASIFFELPSAITNALFDPEYWSIGEEVTAQMVANKIRHLIKTGECISG